MTRHPDLGEQGVNIDREKYDQVRDAILVALSESGELTFTALTGR